MTIGQAPRGPWKPLTRELDCQVGCLAILPRYPTLRQWGRWPFLISNDADALGNQVDDPFYLGCDPLGYLIPTTQ